MSVRQYPQQGHCHDYCCERGYRELGQEEDEHLTDIGDYLVNPSVSTFQGENIGGCITVDFLGDKIGIL